MRRLPAILALTAVWCLPGAALATTATVPEPETWALVAVGLVAAVVIKIRNRRK